MIKGIQIVGLLISLGLLAQTFLNYRRRNYSLRRTLFFSMLWMLVALLFVYPSILELALPVLTTQDVITSALVVGLAVTFVLIAESYQQIGKVERRLRELVQNLAIHEYIKKVSKDNVDDED